MPPFHSDWSDTSRLHKKDENNAFNPLPTDPTLRNHKTYRSPLSSGAYLNLPPVSTLVQPDHPRYEVPERSEEPRFYSHGPRDSPLDNGIATAEYNDISPVTRKRHSNRPPPGERRKFLPTPKGEPNEHGVDLRLGLQWNPLGLGEELQNRERMLRDREAAVKLREAAVKLREEDADRREKLFREREKVLGYREDALGHREEKLAYKEDALGYWEEELRWREAMI